MFSGIVVVAATHHHVIKEWVGDFTSDNNSDHQDESAEKAGSENVLSLPQHPIAFNYHIGIKPISRITLSEKNKQLFVLSILTPPPEVAC